MATSEYISGAVSAELEFDPLIDPGDITVNNNSGEVTLSGTVPSYPQYLGAIAAARRVTGVTRVQNHLDVVPPPVDCREDGALNLTLNEALAANVIVPDNIEATATGGSICMTGTVAYGSQRDAAEATVAALTGVRGITNDIDIRGDADIGDAVGLVQSALDRYSLISDDSEITVAASGSVITLTGHVRTWAEHDAAIGAAWMGSGVCGVRDGLVVTG
jgi:osmotically-inducible protein OsmY